MLLPDEQTATKVNMKGEEWLQYPGGQQNKDGGKALQMNASREHSVYT